MTNVDDDDLINDKFGTDTVLTIDGQVNFSSTLEGLHLDVVSEVDLRNQINVGDANLLPVQIKL